MTCPIKVFKKKIEEFFFSKCFTCKYAHERIHDMSTDLFEKWLDDNGLARKQHQVDGVEFCVENETLHGRGGLIADEMGLGKTYVMLGTMVQNPLPKTLIVLPLALLEQWDKIVKKYLNDLNTFVYHSSNTHDYKSALPMEHDTIHFQDLNPKKKGSKAHALYESYKKAHTFGEAKLMGMRICDFHNDKKHGYLHMETDTVITAVKKLDKAQVVITTYGKTMSSGVKLLYKYQWDRIIFDEAHHLRNMKTTRFTGSNKLSGKIRWLITGTPIQNRLADFYSLCQQMGMKKEYYTDLRNLNSIVKNYIIKRTKKNAGIQLPPINIVPVETTWDNSNEENLSEQIHSLLPFTNVRKDISNSVSHLSGNGYMLPCLIRARQVCIYPKLLKRVVEKHVENGALETDPDFMDAVECNSKIDLVVKTIVERKNNTRNKIVFCHYRNEIDIISDKLIHHGIRVCTFDGRTSHSQRGVVLGKPCDVLILQIQTGCEGLNLQQFKEIYFVSPHWNPAVEDQAIARCHRIGQDDCVDVFRFTMKNFGSTTANIENYINDVQLSKREIADDFSDKCEKATIAPSQ